MFAQAVFDLVAVNEAQSWNIRKGNGSCLSSLQSYRCPLHTHMCEFVDFEKIDQFC